MSALNEALERRTGTFGCVVYTEATMSSGIFTRYFSISFFENSTSSDTVLVSYVIDLSVEFLVMMLFIPSRILAASFLSTPKLSTNALTNSKMVCVS